MTTSRATSKPTTRMTREELARTWADHYGLTGRTGGWIYLDATPIVHGWTALADYLTGRGLIREGVGIEWTATHRVGGGRWVALDARATRQARTAH